MHIHTYIHTYIHICIYIQEFPFHGVSLSPWLFQYSNGVMTWILGRIRHFLGRAPRVQAGLVEEIDPGVS